MPGYAPTPLVEVSELAEMLGVGAIFVKNESARMGLPSFKVLGASWAIHRLLAEQPGGEPVCLVTATEGNHGRAVARAARLLGQRAEVFVPSDVHPAAVAAIAGEGAEVVTVAGGYEDAVGAAAQSCTDPDRVLVQDTAWPGYTDVPGWIVEGYQTLFAEVDAQLAATGAEPPDLVVVPVGVGSLAQGAVMHYRGTRSGSSGASAPALLAVEPVGAACVLESLVAGRLTTVPTSATVLAGLNCGRPSSLAWPYLRAGLDAAVSVTDGESLAAADDLAAFGISAGPCGAASLAGARAALTGAGALDAEDAAAPGPGERRSALGLGPVSTVVLLCTEGAAANPYSSSYADPAISPSASQGSAGHDQ